MEENDALRTLFRDAAATVEAPGLAGRLGEAAASRDESVRISSLDAANDALRALLIELHAELEERDDAASRALCERIWSELVRSTERRRLSLGSF